MLYVQSVQSYERIVLFRLGLLSASLGPGEFDRKHCDIFHTIVLDSITYISAGNLVICICCMPFCSSQPNLLANYIYNLVKYRNLCVKVEFYYTN